MQSLVLCHAAADVGVADELTRFLEVNCTFPVIQNPVIFDAAEELVEAVERSLSADLVVTLLSPESVPKGLRREAWEPVFVEQARELGSKLGWLLVGACRFPEVLRRGAFFDASNARIAGFRKAKRWLLSEGNAIADSAAVCLPGPMPAAGEESLDRLDHELADRPGVLEEVPREAALAFAHTRQEDFEGVFWVDCDYRSRAGIVGATAQMLGLKLRGRAEANNAALGERCGERRCLFVFDGVTKADRELLAFSRRASVIFTKDEARRPLRSLPEIETAFSSGRSCECLAVFGDAHAI